MVTPWTTEEYLAICAERQKEADEWKASQRRGDYALLNAVGLLHPEMNDWALFFYGLAGAIKYDAVVMQGIRDMYSDLDDELAALPPAVDRESYIVSSTPSEDYVEVVKGMSKDQIAALRKRIATSDGWQKWAATKS